MGDELMKRESEGMEKLEADLESSSVSLKAALSANINLAGTNKDLEDKLERANAGIDMLYERCLVDEYKDENANKRASDLRGEVEELKGEVAALKADWEEDRRRMAKLEKELDEL